MTPSPEPPEGPAGQLPGQPRSSRLPRAQRDPGIPVARATYRYLRLMLITLPALLLVGTILAFFLLGTIETSISAYYLGPIRDIFVGVMVGTAACLVAYRGASPLEDFSLDVAGFFMVVVALVPTDLAETLAALDPDLRDETVTALRASVVALLLVAGGFIALEIRLSPWTPAPLQRHRFTRVAANVMNAALVAFVVLVLWRVIEGVSFAWVHTSAAGLLIASLAVAVASHAWPETTAVDAESRDASRDGLHRDHRGKYRLIFWLMVAGLPALAALAAAGWPYAVLVVEWYEIALFIAFWVLETRRTWSPWARRRPSPGAEIADAG